MVTGTVKMFNDERGFGFISQENGGEDIFVHHSAIETNGPRSLNQGDRVQFEVTKEAKGMRATNVRVIS